MPIHHCSHAVESLPCPPREFLLNGGSLAQLIEKYGIEVRRHGRFPNLVQLKYNQIESPMGDPLVQECRGLILDQDSGWTIVAWPFKKFFNLGEGHAAPVDWSTAKVQEKMDGSLMVLYRYDGKWQVASSGLPDASGQVMGSHYTFEELFWHTWESLRWPEPTMIHYAHSLMFELTSPFNRVVVQHPHPNLTLIGRRSKFTGLESPITFMTDFSPVRVYGFETTKDMLDSFEKVDPLSCEGYVVVDMNFNRVKVKHPGYVALHQLKSGYSVRRIVEIVRNGEYAEVLAHFPEWRPAFDTVRAAYDGLVLQLQQDHEDIRDIGDRKTFAIEAQKSFYPGVHFLLRDGEVTTVKQCLQTHVHLDKLVTMLGVRGVVLEGAI